MYFPVLKCTILFAPFGILGYNKYKKKKFIEKHGNSGWLRVNYTDLTEEATSLKTATFYNKVTERSARNMSIRLAQMQLTMLQGGQITVSSFDHLLIIEKFNQVH